LTAAPVVTEAGAVKEAGAVTETGTVTETGVVAEAGAVTEAGASVAGGAGITRLLSAMEIKGIKIQIITTRMNSMTSVFSGIFFRNIIHQS
jgi:hypothetical protein